MSTESQAVVKHLQQLLADYQLHYQNLRAFHWNVKGNMFFVLHAKFEELYTDVAMKIDEIAERIRSLDAKPLSRFSEYLEHSQIKEAENSSDPDACVRQVVNAHEILIADVQKVLAATELANDSATEDLFTGYIAEVEKENWMLKSYLG